MHAFSALADGTRRRIVEILAQGERPAGDISSQFEISPQAVSQHLKILKEARIVRVRADATRRLYAIDEAGLAEIDDWLEGVRQFWAGRLDTFEQQYLDHRTKARGKKTKKNK